MERLIPINGCVLVELTESLDYVDIPDKQYSTKTSGIVLATTQPIDGNLSHEYLVGKRVYFKDYEDGTKVEIDGKQTALIKYEEIRGYVEVK